MTRKATEITDMQLDFVSLVDKGAHQDAFVVISKRDDDAVAKGGCGHESAGDSAYCPDCGASMDGAYSGKSKGMKGMKMRKFMTGMADSLGYNSDDATPGSLYKADETAGYGEEHGMSADSTDDLEMALEALPPVVKNYIEALEASVSDEAIADRVEKAIEKMAADAGIEFDDDGNVLSKWDPEDDDDDEVLKSLDPGVRDYVESIRKRAEDAEEIAKAEQANRMRTELIAKVHSDYPTLTKTDGENIAKAFFAVLGDDDATTALEAAFGRAEEQARIGKAFTSVGAAASGESTHNDKVMAIAKSMRDADPSMTAEQAIAKVYESNPALYTEYLSGNSAR